MVNISTISRLAIELTKPTETALRAICTMPIVAQQTRRFRSPTSRNRPSDSAICADVTNSREDAGSAHLTKDN